MSPPMTDLGAPGSEAKTVIAVATCAMTISVTAVAARFYARCILLKNTGARRLGATCEHGEWKVDDAVTVNQLDEYTLTTPRWSAALSTRDLLLTLLLGTRYGLGLHTSELHIDTLIEFFKHLFALILVYNTALTILKASFCCSTAASSHHQSQAISAMVFSW
ncbi:hypothetical protein BCR34DRAFT_71811 [Clohesyomyces aquaticus]|uniref:Uncharacterized protein n=1 Tax=Clohesyomyces aquaticus TaxID=1231657 RepID=A0A1Y1Z057_9PLEO|nr:hypothetical protein BCR34DRAFT_71811 [Clohesyomyces aquaticus]